MAKTTRFFYLMRSLLCIALVLISFHADARPRHRAHHAQRTPAQDPRYAMIIMDAQSGRILDEKNADKPLPPASLTKLMTLFLTFEAVEQGKLRMNSNLVITPNAMKQPPSKLNLKRNEKITVDQAIHVLITRSANDVAMALAETVGGSSANFTKMMTARAHSLGMKNSYFYNPSGLPNPQQKSSARDMAILGRAIMQYFPQHYHLFSTIRYNYKGQTIETHNNLMRRFKGMDGLKTGYTVASGFNLVASSVRNNRRIIVVVFGGRSAPSRDNHVADLMNKGLAELTGGAPAVQVASPKAIPAPIRKAPVTPPTVTTKTIVNTTDTIVTPPRPTSAPDNAVVAARQFNTSTTTVETRTSTATDDRAGWRPDGGAVKPLGHSVTSAPAKPVYQSTTSGGNWGIQVGAYNSAALSQQSVQAAQARLRSVLGGTGQAAVVPAATAQGTIYRARIIGLSAQNASKACQILSDCMAFTVR